MLIRVEALTGINEGDANSKEGTYWKAGAKIEPLPQQVWGSNQVEQTMGNEDLNDIESVHVMSSNSQIQN